MDEGTTVPSPCIGVEVWKFSGIPIPSISEPQALTVETLQHWLHKPFFQTQNGRRPMGGLRLIVSITDSSTAIAPITLPFSTTIYESIVKNFGIQEKRYTRALAERQAGFAKYSETDAQGTTKRITFILRTLTYERLNCCLGMSFDPETQVTRVLLLGAVKPAFKNQVANNEIIANTMKEWPRLMWHPMFMPFLVITLATQITRLNVEANEISMLRIEAQTSLHIDQGSKLQAEENVSAAIGNLTRASHSLSFTEISAETVLLLIRNLNNHLHFINSVRPFEEVGGLQFLGEILKDNIQEFRDTIECLLHQAKHVQRRGQTQSAIVYNIIAQRDSKLNMEIARDSKSIAAAAKDDGYSMKTIAWVTLVFLPPATVAAFYSMGFFNWNASDGAAVLSQSFWIYWATTLPLTVLVLVLWRFLLWSYKRKQKEEEAKVRKSGILATREDESLSVESDPPAGQRNRRVGEQLFELVRLNLRRGRR